MDIVDIESPGIIVLGGEEVEISSIFKEEDIPEFIIKYPENDLRSEFYTYLAEILVLIAKKFNKKILITTNSFRFLESLIFFIRKYDYIQPVEYYLVRSKDFFEVSNYPDDLMKRLAPPWVDLDNR